MLLGRLKIAALFTSFFVFSFTACKKEKKSEDRGSDGSALQISAAGDMINDIGVALEENGLSSEQAGAITAGALQVFTGESETALKSDIDPYDPYEAAVAIAAAAVAATGSKAAKLSEDEIAEVVGIIVEALMASLGDGKTQQLSNDEQKVLLGGVARSAIGALNAAKVCGDQLPVAIGYIVEKSSAGISTAALSDDVYEDAIGNLTEEAFVGMKQLGQFSSENFDQAFLEVVPRLVSGFSNANIKSNRIEGLVEPVFSNSFKAMDTFGIPPSQAKGIMGSTMEGAVNALGQANMPTAHFGAAIGAAITGAMSGLSNFVPAGTLPGMLPDLINRAASSMTVAVTNTNDITNLTNNFAARAVNHSSAIGLNVTNAAQYIAQGASAGLSAIATKGIMNTADLQTATQSMTASFMENMHHFSQTTGINLGNAVTGITKGFTNGFSMGGMSSTTISQIGSSMGAGINSAFTAAGMNPSTITGYQNTSLNTATAFANEMKVPCQAAHGSWNETTKICTYPQPAANFYMPHTRLGMISLALKDDVDVEKYKLKDTCEAESVVPEGGSGPSAEELEKCQDVGGAIFYKADNSWFCDTSAGTTADTQASCEDAGFTWVSGSDGNGFCETAPTSSSTCRTNTSPTNCAAAGCMWEGTYCKDLGYMACYDNTTRESCSEKTACGWIQDRCQNKAMIPCGTNTTDATCNQMPGCMWNGSACSNASAIDCANKPEGTCVGTPGCFWNGNHCVNQQFQFCGSHNTPANCGTATGCSWIDGACRNAASVPCPSFVTEATCTGVCSWDFSNNQCFNSAANNCGLNITEPTCAGKPGCTWNGSCVNSWSNSCGSRAEGVCNADGCMWRDNACVNGGAIPCGTFSESQCHTGCQWNPSNSTCFNSAAINCGSLTSSGACDGNSSCIWNTGSSTCGNKNAIDCGGLANSGDCNANGACAWNTTDNVCRNASQIACGEYSAEGTCNATGGCVWDGVASSCFNPSSINCSSYTGQGSCNDHSAVCQWNSTLSTCENKSSGASCGTRSTKDACSGDNSCLWDGSACVSNSICNSKVTMATCNAESNGLCKWNGSACVGGIPSCGLRAADATCAGNSTSHSREVCSIFDPPGAPPPGCFFVPPACNTFGSQSACLPNFHCRWSNSNVCAEAMQCGEQAISPTSACTGFQGGGVCKIDQGLCKPL